METLGTGVGKFNIKFQIGSIRQITFDWGAEDISAWVFELLIKKNIGDRVKTISLTLTNAGLSIPVYTNHVVATFSASNTSIEEGEYYWELRRTDEGIPLISGFAYFTYDSQQGTETESDELDIVITTTLIEVTISNGSVTGGSGGLSTVAVDSVTIIGDGSPLNPLIAVTQSSSDPMTAGDYTFVLGDAYPQPKTKVTISAVPFNMVIPSGVFSQGQYFYVEWEAAGQPTFVAGGGVTLHSPSGSFIMSSVYSISGVWCKGANDFRIVNGVFGSGSAAWSALTGQPTDNQSLVNFVDGEALILGG